MALLEIGGINIRARIDDHRTATCRDFNTQRVIVSVRAASVNADATRVEAEIEITMAHDVSAGVRKGLRTQARSIQFRIVKDVRTDLKEIGMIISATTHERQHLPTIRVADQRRESIWTQITADITQHLMKLRPIPLIDLDIVGAAEHERVKEEFGDEAMVAGWSLEVRSVGEHLFVHLAKRLGQ